MRRAHLALALVAVLAAPAAATDTGLDVGHVVDDGVVHDQVADVVSTGVGWVRINFRLDAWNAPDDATPHGPDQLTWFAAYDRVVDAYLAQGIQVYALINDEAVDSTLDHDTDAWIALYVQNAVKIVDHFKSRIRVWEIINEPNDYAGGTSARFTPHAFAKILQDTYLAVKHDAGHDADRCWQVQLVSGPLFSFDGTDASTYLQQVYDAGRSELAWDYTHQATGSYPLDGVGYHVYVAQGSDSAVSDVTANTTANLDAMWSTITANEGADTAKQLWVSEYGWQADAVGADGQAARMQAGFGAMSATGNVALAVYFNDRDFPGATYGIFDDTGARRPSADMLASLAGANRPVHGARIASVQLPALAPGQTGEAIVTLENRGTATWADGFRLGAAPGCPDAWTTNEVAWTPDAAAGYANSATDARIFLPADVPPGATVALHVPIRAPDQPGDYAFGARMVHEGVTWFGATASGTLHVAAAGSGDPGGPGSSDPAGSGAAPGSGGHAGGCAAGGAGGPSMLVWILATVWGFSTRRRRPA